MEGRAAFAFIRQNFPALDLTILNNEPLGQSLIPAGNVQVIHGDDAVAESVRSGRFDLIVKSPGISLYRQEILDAKARGVRFTSGTNLWFEQNCFAKKIVVTGTKGKSTTSRLLHYMLRQLGLDVQLVGNVGIPTVGHPVGRDYTVLELSSYQIADLEFAPDIAVVTNLFPEHAPWHHGVEQYFRDKLRILNLGKRTRGVCNYANQRLRDRVSDQPNIVWFNTVNGYCARDGNLYFNNELVDCSGFPLKGEHNLSNLAAVWTVADLLGVSSDRHVVDFSTFKQLSHRLEEFRVGAGVLCIDDSISTVPEATMAALNTYRGRDTILLLGGTDRGQDYEELFTLLPGTRVLCVILLPPIGERVFAEMSGRGLEFELLGAADLKEAVREAFQRASAESLILLSPGAPSFGEFKSFEERGDKFKKYCEEYATYAG
jgi:UDP-N-acetylmuramoylalanine--D-glutamate ligase